MLASFPLKVDISDGWSLVGLMTRFSWLALLALFEQGIYFCCESGSRFSVVPHPHFGGEVCYRTPLLGLMSLLCLVSSSSRTSPVRITSIVGVVAKVALSS